jgi:hypothetical protein
MNPKEKAEHLVIKYLRIKDVWIKGLWFNKELAKECALIAAEEIIELLLLSLNTLDYNYWLEVKKEIKEL